MKSQRLGVTSWVLSQAGGDGTGSELQCEHGVGREAGAGSSGAIGGLVPETEGRFAARGGHGPRHREPLSVMPPGMAPPGMDPPLHHLPAWPWLLLGDVPSGQVGAALGAARPLLSPDSAPKPWPTLGAPSPGSARATEQLSPSSNVCPALPRGRLPCHGGPRRWAALPE